MTGGVMMSAANLDWLKNFFWADSIYWTAVGLAGGAMFTSRFVVQWYASEKLKQSIIPKNFWHLSLVGGLINLLYAAHLWKLPVILGALLPPVIAARNLVIISRYGNVPSGGASSPKPAPPTPNDDGSAAMLATRKTAVR